MVRTHLVPPICVLFMQSALCFTHSIYPYSLKVNYMLSFKKITLDDKEILNKYFTYHKEHSCDFTVGVVLMWRDFYSIEYAIDENTLFMKYNSQQGDLGFPFPQGENPISGLDKIHNYFIDTNLKPTFCFVTKDDLSIVNNHFDKIESTAQRMWADYLYDAQSIVDLSGKKFSTQRNHINKFKRLYLDYRFEVIDKDNIQEADEFFDAVTKGFNKTSPYAIEDQKKVKDVLQDCDSYGMFGGMLKVDNKVIGMSFGEIVNDTLFVHIERADITYHGAYQMLVNMFAKTFVTKNVKYINREDDSGDEGLRRSKLSYNPIRLIEKYTVTI